ncbi:phage tail assembly protein [Xanthomonas sp. MUS 060]|uniref:phage tail assembly protein n=1 Tax=Xanthomonas sp. MUS 060 TaxID=1588031 RepID=UPI000695DEF9|nr:phage tail assembly protein [Xanthomonas sp. MUS 060]
MIQSQRSKQSLTLPLSYAVLAHGEEIDCLVLRQPTTGDVIDLGQPMRLLPGNGMEEPAVEVRMNVVAHYVARLAAIPLSSVKALSLGDFGRATQAVLGFFGEDTAPPDRVRRDWLPFHCPASRHCRWVILDAPRRRCWVFSGKTQHRRIE